MVRNPSFQDTRLIPWTFDGTDLDSSRTGYTNGHVHSGDVAMQAVGLASGWTFNLRQTISLQADTAYRLEFWPASENQGNCFLFALFQEITVAFNVPGAGYLQGTAVIDPNPVVRTGELRVTANCRNAGFRLWIDDITMTAI